MFLVTYYIPKWKTVVADVENTSDKLAKVIVSIDIILMN